jgi:RNA polymerase sigma-70 factor, ECF subfamily
VANEPPALHATAVTNAAAPPSRGPAIGVAEERALVEGAQQGDQRAIRALYMLHANTVFRCAIMPLVRDRNLAEDLLADTFVRAIENLPRFRWQGKGLLPWLIRIGKNLCLDHLRKAGRTTAWPEGFEQQIPDLSDSDAESLLGRAELSDVLRERIEACLTEVNPRYRRVLELRLIEKCNRQDAAAAMDVTVGTLDVLLFRACKSFRKIYARRYAGDDVELPQP